jgi:hypothetical protein
MIHYELCTRLHPDIPLQNLDKGLTAEIADPAWFLARQWLMGEHYAEDAATPVGVTCYWITHPIGPPIGRSLDPANVPAEAIVEAEAEGPWTPGLRLRTGSAFAKSEGLLVHPPTKVRAQVQIGGLRFAVADLICTDLPEPYSRFNGAWDGRAIKLALSEQNITHHVFASILENRADAWNKERLHYDIEFPVSDGVLKLPNHKGGRIDWHSTDLKNPPTLTAGNNREQVFIPTRFWWNGAPAPRWWEIERSSVDVGAFAPDRGHPVTLLLLELLTAHSDDWFTFPFPGRTGELITLDKAAVRDSFDEWWIINPPTDWSLFQVRQPPGTMLPTLPVWTTVENPLRGELLEEAKVVVDHDTNLVWWVQERINGTALTATPAPASAPEPTIRGPVDANGPLRHRYRPIDGLREHWVPYQLSGTNRQVVQGRLSDLNQRPPRWLSAPTGSLNDSGTTLHRLDQGVLIGRGHHIHRRWVMARGVDGRPYFWVERLARPLTNVSPNPLRFDVAESVPDPT